MAKETRRRYLWDNLNRGTAKLYALISRSFLGRLLTGYRKADDALAKGRRYPGRNRCTPMSPARLHLLSAVESGRLFSGARTLFHFLFRLPTALYGLFLLLYGAVGAALYFVLPYLYAPLAPDTEHLILSAVVAALALPAMMTKKTLAETLMTGRASRFLLIRLLGFPEDRIATNRTKVPFVLPYATVLLAIAAAGGALFVHPLLIPVLLLIVGLVGLIFAYPEAGVVASTLLLPAIWLNRNALYVLCVIILLTWLSYGVKLLFMHRTIRFGLLDTVVLLFGGLLLLSGFTGVVVNSDTIVRSVMLFICLSDYFLIVNLMTTRAYIRRCLAGVGLSVAVVTLLAYLRMISADGLAWLEGSRAGNAIVSAAESGLHRASGLWVEHSELYLVVVFPWLYAYLCHTKRLLRRVAGLAFVGLDLLLVLMTDSISALFSVIIVTLIFFLLLSHKGLSTGLVALPAVGVGVWWVTYLYPVSDAMQTVLSRSRHFKEQLTGSLWQMVKDHPAGVGVGETAFAAVYPTYAAPDLGAVTDSGSLYFELLIAYGWPGLLLFAALLFFFVQKSVTCLGHTADSRDRAMILGGVTSMAGVLIFGVVRSFMTAPRVFFTLMLVVSLCSAYENVLFDENDVLTARRAGTSTEEDRIILRG
ncbi:MAG: O-antigen ligase family protein [Clostridia bacterium]|nr:O-antigen ligase family protein [Clostridia bacterium]